MDMESKAPAGRGADTLPGGRRYFAPLRTGRGPVGVVGLDSDKPGALLTPELQRLFEALLDQSALAIERVNLVSDLDSARRVAETDRLRSALLTSISHDLKTPLASIHGSATAIRDLRPSLDEAAETELVASIIDESERLNRFITNLLDMTRLEAGAVMATLAPQDVDEIVGTALRRASKILSRHKVEVEVAADLPMPYLDAVLFEQVLFNLLDNAAKYASDGTTITIQGGVDATGLFLRVLDEGDGIPESDLPRIFEKFYRARKGDRVRAGTGLGLAISRGFIEAMGGTIVAANRSDRSGAALTLRLPMPQVAHSLTTAA
jgi:Osmosensitive K+ channel histidine kinase